MVDDVLDLEEKLNDLIEEFEITNKVAVTSLTLNRENQTEDFIGNPVIKAMFIVPYTMSR